MDNGSSLRGYVRQCVKTTGGVASISMIESCKVEGFVLDKRTGAYSGMRLKAGAEFIRYRFREGAASLSEETAAENGIIRTGHTVEFSMDKMDEGTAACLRGFIGASGCGIVAVATTAEGVSIVVGYSEEFKGERPLRVSGALSATGKTYTDRCGSTVTLASKDASPSRIFTGTIV